VFIRTLGEHQASHDAGRARPNTGNRRSAALASSVVCFGIPPYLATKCSLEATARLLQATLVNSSLRNHVVCACDTYGTSAVCSTSARVQRDSDETKFILNANKLNSH
jgi:hypothetical protein